eukprot:tig00020693_g13053.t1
MVFCIFHPPHIMSKHFSDAEDETSTAAARACAESFGGLTFSRTSHNGLKAAYVLQSPEACAFATWLLGTSSGLELGGDDTGAYVLQGPTQGSAQGVAQGPQGAAARGACSGLRRQELLPRKEPPHPPLSLTGDAQAPLPDFDRFLSLLRENKLVRDEIWRAGAALRTEISLNDPRRVQDIAVEPDGTITLKMSDQPGSPALRIAIRAHGVEVEQEGGAGDGSCSETAASYVTDPSQPVALDVALPSLLIALESTGLTPHCVKVVDTDYLTRDPGLLTSTFGPLEPGAAQVDVICSGLNTGKTQALIETYLKPALEGAGA